MLIDLDPDIVERADAKQVGELRKGGRVKREQYECGHDIDPELVVQVFIDYHRAISHLLAVLFFN